MGILTKIIGNTIYFDGEPVAKFNPEIRATLLDSVTNFLNSANSPADQTAEAIYQIGRFVKLLKTKSVDDKITVKEIEEIEEEFIQTL